MNKTALTLAFLALSACDSPPPPPPPPVYPDPAPFDAEILAAVAEVHGPSVCALPLVQKVTYAQYTELTGMCGNGRCQGCGIYCSTAELVDGVIVTLYMGWPSESIRLALESLHACEGTAFDRDEYIDVLDILRLR